MLSHNQVVGIDPGVDLYDRLNCRIKFAGDSAQCVSAFHNVDKGALWTASLGDAYFLSDSQIPGIYAGIRLLDGFNCHAKLFGQVE